ncbi:putative Alpha--fucosyltransferase C [Daphnia magna]|uniref:Fucosyltransferase n=1 Tax=Daphnia magna TaxID=35525 RepID=A0A0P5WEY8_9CRUS|nr:putative Alpha--fucosyltransferase C [Daphnia magna]
MAFVVMLRQRQLLRAFLLSVLISMCLYLHTAYYAEVEHPGLLRQIGSRTKEASYDKSKWERISAGKRTKNILMWKKIWGYKLEVGRSPFIDANCPISNCFLTYNTSFLPPQDFDAIMIHPSTQRIPHNFKNRRPDQIFLMFNNEPPAHLPRYMEMFDNYFNWTMTYRTGSTFHLKYGEIIPLDSAPTTMDQAMAMRQEMMRSGINPAKGKTKLAVWFVTNCNAESNREAYVSIMQKYTTIDIFSSAGKCGGRDECPRIKNRSVCYNLIEKSYKFYLSFENSICEEYVTEKFFEMMNRNIVPVVLGGADYAAIAPPHSYINALDYTPRQLAEYLKELDRNDTLYAEYFWWKKRYRVNDLHEMTKTALCDLCEALHTTPLKNSTVKGLQRWLLEPSLCRHFPIFKDN